MLKTVIMTLKGTNFQEMGNWPFMNLKKKLNTGNILTLSLGYIHVYDKSNKFIGIYLRSQVSVYRTIGSLVIFYRSCVVRDEKTT